MASVTGTGNLAVRVVTTNNGSSEQGCGLGLLGALLANILVYEGVSPTPPLLLNQSPRLKEISLVITYS